MGKKAPFDRTVNINAPVALLQDAGLLRNPTTRQTGLGWRSSIKGTELWSTNISATDFTPKNPSGVSSVVVQKVSRIYFRVQSIANGAYDHVLKVRK
ncbi:MAG: hypothetical protein MZV63_16685 [Marinilabiliales bacterium]|nr:hypothetical protein [Marinilabiliales bacterium]